MTRQIPVRSSWFLLVSLVAGLAFSAPVAFAGEADDLQNMIERQRQGTQDLERLDDRGATREETTLLRTWLDEAWRYRSEGEFDKVRVVLVRCDAQTEMIRQKINASKLTSVAAEKEAALQKLRAQVERTKKALDEARLLKAGLEARTK